MDPTVQKHLSAIGHQGGIKTSARKSRAARNNGRKGGRPPKGPQREAALKEWARYIWWQPAKASLKEPDRILIQVMNLGVLEDVQKLDRLFPPSQLRTLTQKSLPGQLTPKSWCWWHLKLGLAATYSQIPPPPRRIFA